MDWTMPPSPGAAHPTAHAGSETPPPRACVSRTRPLVLVVCLAGLLTAGCGEDREPPTGPGEETSQWVDRAPLPRTLRYFGAAVYRDAIIVAGGVDVDFIAQRAVYRYVPAANVWTRLADLPAGARSIELVVAEDTLYAVGGVTEGGKSLELLLAYDAAADAWRERVPIPDARYDFVPAYAAGHIVLLGGPIVPEASEHGPRIPGDSVLAYEVRTGTWHRRGLNPDARLGARGVAVGDRVFVFGGLRSERISDPVTAFTRYNAATDTWAPALPDPLPSNLPHVARHGDRIHVIGGIRPIYASAVGPHSMPEHRVLDTRTNSWSLLPDLPRGVVDARLVAVADTLYVMSGRLSVNTATPNMIALRLKD